MEVQYTGHISESEELLQTLRAQINEGGKSVLLTAGCGSGKTYFMLKTLSSAIAKEGKRVILTVPTSLQSEQNASYQYESADGTIQRVIPVTGTSKNIVAGHNECCCTVYDLNIQILDLPDSELANTVFIIDEAHQLQTSLNYRKTAISHTLKAAEKVLSCNGTVIYMTGTPRRLEDCSFDEVIRCVRTDEAGKVIPQVNFSGIRVLYRASKATSFEDCTVNEILSLLEEGKHPIVRINDKDMIGRISTQLLKANYTVRELTSEDKTCALIDGRKRYLSDTYESVVESHILPEADCYLVTSVLETGTSITGRTQNGQTVQDSSLTPVYVASRSSQFDMDELAQFFARPRFAVSDACLILNFAPDPTKHAHSLGEILYRLTTDACARRDGLNHDFTGMEFDRSLVRSLKGEDERRGLYFDARSREWELDHMQIRDNACRTFDKERYIHRKEALVSALDDLFRIGRENISVSACQTGNGREKVETGTLPEQFDLDVKELLLTDEVSRSLEESVRPDLSCVDELFRFSKKNYVCSSGIELSGNAILSRICKYTIKGIYSVEQAAGFVKKQYETGSVSVTLINNPDDGSVRRDPLEFAASCAAIQMTQESLDRQNFLIWYYESHYLGKLLPYESASRRLTDVFDAADAKKYAVMLGSHYFSAIYQAYSLVSGHMDLCEILAQPFADTEEGAIDWIYQTYYAELNTRPRYWISNTVLQSSAEYAILTNPGCFIPDYCFAEQKEKGNRTITLELGGGKISLRDFDRAKTKTLDMRTLTWIAYNMITSMRSHFRKGRFSGSYTAEDILTLLKRIYSYELIYNKDKTVRAIKLVHLRTRAYTRAGKDARLKFLNDILADSSESDCPDTRQYAVDQAKNGLKKICHGDSRKMIPAIVSMLENMMHLDNGAIRNDFKPEGEIYSFTADMYPSFYVDHSIQVLHALFSEHPEMMGTVSSFMDLVADGTYEQYCKKLGLRTDARINCIWTDNPKSMAA